MAQGPVGCHAVWCNPDTDHLSQCDRNESALQSMPPRTTCLGHREVSPYTPTRQHHLIILLLLLLPRR